MMQARTARVAGNTYEFFFFMFFPHTLYISPECRKLQRVCGSSVRKTGGNPSWNIVFINDTLLTLMTQLRMSFANCTNLFFFLTMHND